MGDLKIARLYCRLPLSVSGNGFELFPETLTIQVNYHGTFLNVGKEARAHKVQQAQLVFGALVSEDEWSEDQYISEVRKSLIYNSTAAFALTDNLEHVVYVFTDGAYQVNCEDVKALYEDVGLILDEIVWKNHVQDKLKDSLYVEIGKSDTDPS